MATKKAAGKTPRKRATATDETVVDNVIKAGEKLLKDRAATDRPGGLPPHIDLQHVDLERAPPTDEEADAAVENDADVGLAEPLKRALLFCDNEHPYVRCLPNMVIGAGRRGSVYVPWSAAAMPAEGVVVDGRRLHRVLRLAGADAVVKVDVGGSIVVTFGSSRAKVARANANVTPIPIPPDVQWSVVDASVFQRAVAFAGDDKIEPPGLAHVHVEGGSVVSCDRRTLYLGLNFTDNTTTCATVPREAFDGIEGRCYFAVGATHAFIGDPVKGDYRAFVTFGHDYPDVRGTLPKLPCDFEVDIDKLAFAVALKRMAVVQSRGSSVKLNIWMTPEGHWMEMRGGDAAGHAELVARLGVRIRKPNTVDVPTGLAGGTGHFRILAPGASLLKLAALALGDVVRLGFSTPDTAIVVREATYQAAVCPMVADAPAMPEE